MAQLAGGNPVFRIRVLGACSRLHADLWPDVAKSIGPYHCERSPYSLLQVRPRDRYQAVLSEHVGLC